MSRTSIVGAGLLMCTLLLGACGGGSHPALAPVTSTVAPSTVTSPPRTPVSSAPTTSVTTPAGSVTEYSTGRGNVPYGITSGPDGALWFTVGGEIGRITTAGKVTKYPVTPLREPQGITVGPDGNLWFTEAANAIGRITPSGQVTEFKAGITKNGDPIAIALGRDGNLWFTEHTGPRNIGRITPTGQVTEFTVPLLTLHDGQLLDGIAAGPDGAMWFAVGGGSGTAGPFVGRITTAGVVTTFADSATNALSGVVAGPDEAMWFGGGGITRVTSAGTVTGTNYIRLSGAIAVGPDGALWYTEQDRLANNGYIARTPIHG